MRFKIHHMRRLLIAVVLSAGLSAGCDSPEHTPDLSPANEQVETTESGEPHDTPRDSSSVSAVHQADEIAGYLHLARNFSALRQYGEVDRVLHAADSCGLSDRRLDDLLNANLLSWAESSLSIGDSTTLARCLLRLTQRPLPDSVLQAAGRMIGIGYRITIVTDNVVADYAPKFFPGGKRIVFFSRLEREGLEDITLHDIRYQTQIRIQDIEGGEPMVISDGRASEFFPDVSPDGRYVVCQRADGDTLKGEWTAAQDSYLYLYDLQTGKGRPLGQDNLYGTCPRFTPSGTAVVFVTGSLGTEGRISTVDIQTGELTPRYRYTKLFRFNVPGAVFYPSFFPDGKRMVFQAGYLQQKGVYTSDEYGRDIVRLTQNVREWNQDAREWNPAVSPDGKNIVFISQGAYGEELFICRTDGAARRQITFDTYDKAFPSYSPDGRFIAYSAKKMEQPDADYEIYMVDLLSPPDRAQIVARAREIAQRYEPANDNIEAK